MCAHFSRGKAVNKMTILFPLSYHVEKPIMVMLSISGNLCLSLLSPTILLILTPLLYVGVDPAVS